MNPSWYEIALIVEKNYAGYVDWEEGFFNCPECGEPIYEEDWNTEDLIDGNGNFICPVCEEVLD